MPGVKQSSVLKNTAAINSGFLTYDLSLAQRNEKYKRTLLQIVKSNISKYSTGAASYAVTIENKQDPDANHNISIGKHISTGNIFEIRNIMASENCTITDSDENITTYEDPNTIIRSTKDKVKFVEKQAEQEAGGTIPSDQEYILDGDDYDANGNFILKLEKKLPLVLGHDALKLTLMKSLLPTEHIIDKKRESLNHYNLTSDSSYLWDWTQTSIFTAGSAPVANKFTNLPNQIKSLILSATNVDGVNPAVKPWQLSETSANEPYNDLALYAYYYFNYKSIFRVEALTGYLNNGDVVSPVWETVTSDLLVGLFPEGDNVFCRLVRWTDSVFNADDIPEEGTTKMALYDQYFVINNSAVVTNPTQE
tara:strand:- start:907 stop:2001 length:1095 start_codon:yes stop_codon:yes gene_type:complete